MERLAFSRGDRREPPTVGGIRVTVRLGSNRDN